MTPIFYGSVVDGKLRWQDKRAVMEHVWSHDGHEVEVTIKRKRSQRSIKANSYYWGVVLETIRTELGWNTEDKDALHESLAHKFLRIEDDPLTGLVRRKSTRDLSTDEFSAYTDDCIRFAAEHGIVVPAPNEVEL